MAGDADVDGFPTGDVNEGREAFDLARYVMQRDAGETEADYQARLDLFRTTPSQQPFRRASSADGRKGIERPHE